MNISYNLIKNYRQNNLAKIFNLKLSFICIIKFKIKRRIKIKIWKSRNILSRFVNKAAAAITISKPKNQFYLTFFNGVNYNYSSGMIIKSLKLKTRSIRRTKAGFYLFFSFFLKKWKIINQSGKKIVIFLKNFNKINILKRFLTKFLDKTNLVVILSISKNYNLKNYKRVSFINKRLRRKYPIE